MESPEEDRSLDTSLQGELAKGQQRAKERNDNLHTPNRSNHIPISVIELKIAEREILKHVQSQYFKVELLCLNDSDDPIKTKTPPLRKGSAIYKLDPVSSRSRPYTSRRSPAMSTCRQRSQQSSYPAENPSRRQVNR